MRDVEPAARAMGLRIQVLNASTNDAPEPFEVGGPGGHHQKMKCGNDRAAEDAEFC